MGKHFNVSRYQELLELEASVQCQIAYNQKENYFSLIEKYLDRQITTYEFRSTFLEMESQDSREAFKIKQDFRKLEVLRLADDLEKFTDLTNEISALCFEYSEQWNESMTRMSESELYSLVNNHYRQLRKAFPAPSSKNLAYENLISRSFKILRWIIGLEILLILFNISNIN